MMLFSFYLSALKGANFRGGFFQMVIISNSQDG